MLISIIVPVYNAERTLRKCVESLVFGDESDIEVILTDDCSTDGSWAICLDLEKTFANVHSYQNDKNRGVSFTRNSGIQKAKGDYLLFVDSDDWVSGRYVSKLKEYVIKYPDKLVLCGYHFIDHVNETKTEYLLDNEKTIVELDEADALFLLREKTLLQQLWNKAFNKSVIDHNNICFDTAQSMGEDFQFVLDYLEAVKTNKCIVINEPLYYYVRWSNFSLMSRFGLLETENENKRLDQLLRVSGEADEKNRESFLNAQRSMKESFIYRIMRAPQLTKRERISKIDSIMKDGHAEQHYREQKLLLGREWTADALHKQKKLLDRAANKLKRIKNSLIIRRMRKKLSCDGFSVISQNCIGGVFYHDMGLQFKSPTVNLFFTANDFLKFAQNLEHYLSIELKMHWAEEYPVGYLDDVQVFFMHYNSCSEAKEKWEERKRRIDRSKVVVLSTDMEGFDDAAFEQWKRIPYPKLLFTAKQREGDTAVFFRKYSNREHVPDLIPGREFYKNGRIIEVVNSLQQTR